MDTKWQDITRRLDLTLATVDSTVDKEKAKGRAITKNRKSFVIPAYYTDHIDLGNRFMWPGRIAIQYNYTAPAPFRLLNSERVLQLQVQQKIPYCGLMLSYREGNTKVRYRLTEHKEEYFWDETFVAPTNPAVAANYTTRTQLNAMVGHGTPLYNKQRIPVNFSIELWPNLYYWGFSIVNNTTEIPPQGLMTDIELETNLLYNPESVNDVGYVFTHESSITEFEADNAIPEELPVDQSELVQWLDNV
jgi:hypothetical protein